MLIFAFGFISAYPQDKDTYELTKNQSSIGLTSSIGICEVNQPVDKANISSSHGNLVISYGLIYDRTLTKRLKIETGICYAKYSIEDHIISEPFYNFYVTENYYVISIPVLFKYYFPNDYYLSGGTILDLVAKRGDWKISDSMNGFALSTGIGKEITIKKFYISLGVNFDLHTAIPFSGDLSQQKFFVPGFKVVLGRRI